MADDRFPPGHIRWEASKTTMHNNGAVMSWNLRSFDGAPTDSTIDKQHPPEEKDTPEEAKTDPNHPHWTKLKEYGAGKDSVATLTKCPVASTAPWSWVVRIMGHNIDWRNGKYTNGFRATNVGETIPALWGNGTAWFAQAAHNDGEKATYLITAAHNLLQFNPDFDDHGRLTGKDGKPSNINCLYKSMADAVYIVATHPSGKVFGCWAESVSVMTAFVNDPDTVKRRDMAALRIKNSNIPAAMYEAAPQITRIPTNWTLYSIHFVLLGYPSKAAQSFTDLAGLYFGRKRKEPLSDPNDYGITAFDKVSDLRISKFDNSASDVEKTKQGMLEWPMLKKSATGDVGNTSIRGMSGGPGVGALVVEDAQEGTILCALSINVSDHTGSIFADVTDGNMNPPAGDPIKLLIAVGATRAMAWKPFKFKDVYLLISQ